MLVVTGGSWAHGCANVVLRSTDTGRSGACLFSSTAISSDDYLRSLVRFMRRRLGDREL